MLRVQEVSRLAFRMNFHRISSNTTTGVTPGREMTQAATRRLKWPTAAISRNAASWRRLRLSIIDSGNSSPPGRELRISRRLFESDALQLEKAFIIDGFTRITSCCGCQMGQPGEFTAKRRGPRRRTASTIKTVNDLSCDGESRIIISNQ